MNAPVNPFCACVNQIAKLTLDKDFTKWQNRGYRYGIMPMANDIVWRSL